MKKQILYTPRKLNLEAIVKMPPGFKNFTIEKLILIVHLINALPAKNRKSRDKASKNDGYVSLSAELLRKQGIHNYNEYLKYLIERGVIESDNRFIKGKKTRGYRICKKYRSRVKGIVVRTMRRGNTKQFLAKTKTRKKHRFLKWFETGKLTIDMSRATEYLEKTYDPETETNKFNYSLITCGGIDQQDFYYTIDTTSQRLHTNLTNLPKPMKQFVTYDGKQLVGVDVKNAQPYFSTVILRQEFYYEGEFTLDRILKQTSDKEEVREAVKAMKQQGSISAITLLDSLGDTERQNIKWYIELVSSGQVYEVYMLKYKEMWGKDLSRAVAKERFIKQLFSSEKHYEKDRLVFSSLFPAVHRVFNALASGHYRGLSVLLQRIESYLMLEKVCKQISREKPDLPIFTIHDNVITIVGYEEYIASVIKSVLRDYVGYEPGVGIEPWG